MCPMSNENTAYTSDKDLTSLLMRPDVQQAVTDLMEELPKLTPLIKLLSKAASVGSEALSDGDLMAGVTEKVRDSVRPLQEKKEEYTGLLKEANERAKRNQDQIGIFGVLRLLKDPSVQYALRYVTALTELTSEKRRTGM
jgi:uncharacterized protein YjgD (DUF1641 family)